MTAPDDQRLERVIAESCGHGDHLRLDHLPLRAAVGLALILLGTMRRRSRPSLESDVLLVIANGVAHGSRLADALADSLPGGLTYTVVADQRLVSSESQALNGANAVHAPSLAPRSVWQISSISRLREYVRLRRALKTSALRHTSSRLYDEYVFLGQTLRFLTARDSVSETTRLLVCDFDRPAYSYPWVWACKRIGIPTVTAVHGTPAAATYLPVLADAALAWGQVQHGWFARLSPATRVLITGRPEIESRATVSPVILRVVICHSREELSQSEVARLVKLVESCRSAGVGCVLRLHPSSTEADGTGWKVIAAGLVKDEAAGRIPFAQSLRGGDLVVGISTSALVDGLLAGHPVVGLADVERVLPPDVAAITELSRGHPLEGDSLRKLPPQYLGALAALSHDLVQSVGEASRRHVRRELEAIAFGRDGCPAPPIT